MYYKTPLFEKENKYYNRMFWTRPNGDFSIQCIVIQDARATRDVTFNDNTVKAEDVHYSTLSTLKYGGYAKVIDQNEFKENTEKYLQLDLD